MNAEQLTRLFEPVVASLGLECLGVEFVASRGSGLVRVSMPPHSVRVLAPVTTPGPGGYSVYKRMP